MSKRTPKTIDRPHAAEQPPARSSGTPAVPTDVATADELTTTPDRTAAVPRPALTNRELRGLAARHRPPEDWFEGDDEKPF